MYHSILLAYDGSRDGREALNQGATLAKICGASVRLLAVVDWQNAVAADGTLVVVEDKDAFEVALHEGMHNLRRRGLILSARLEFGDPAEEIVRSAHEIQADLIVIGHRKQSSFARWLNGSVGASILKRAPCSILVAVASQA